MNTQRGFAPILLILLGFIVVGGGTYFYMMNRENFEDTAEYSSKFKTYTNTDFGFSIYIPPDMNISEDSKGSEPTILFQNILTSFVVRKYEIGKYGDSIDEVYQRKTSGLYPKIEDNLNDKRALRYSLPAHGEGGEFFSDQTILIIENGGYIYQIEFNKKELEKIDLDILASFKFIEIKDKSTIQAVNNSSKDTILLTDDMYQNGTYPGIIKSVYKNADGSLSVDVDFYQIFTGRQAFLELAKSFYYEENQEFDDFKIKYPTYSELEKTVLPMSEKEFDDFWSEWDWVQRGDNRIPEVTNSSIGGNYYKNQIYGKNTNTKIRTYDLDKNAIIVENSLRLNRDKLLEYTKYGELDADLSIEKGVIVKIDRQFGRIGTRDKYPDGYE